MFLKSYEPLELKVDSGWFSQGVELFHSNPIGGAVQKRTIRNLATG